MRAHFWAMERWIGKAKERHGLTSRECPVKSGLLLKLQFLFMIVVLVTAQPALAGTTGAWTTGASSTATANGITVTNASSASLSPATSSMGTTNYWTNPYGGSIVGAPTLSAVVVPGSGVVTVTVTFNKAVSNPVLHVQRLGGSSTTTNSSSWQLSGSNLAVTPTLTRLSGNFQFQVNGTNTTFFRPAGVASPTGACSSAANSTTDNGGAACGSVRINGTGITSLTFSVSMIGNVGIGDGLDFVWSIPNEAIVVKKQSIGGTGTFSFSGTNGAPTTTLNTATSNPISSTAASVTNLTSAITITEASTPGFTLTGASCVDQTAATIASSLSGGTLTIGSNAYSDNGTVTCTFVNQAIPILSVVKSAPSPALVFGTNSTYSLTVTNSGAAPATTAQIKDQLPAGLSFVSAAGTNWTCNNVSGLLTCNFAGGSIGVSGGTSVVTVVATPLATAGNTTATNYASVDPTGGSAAPTPGAGCSPAAACSNNVSQIAAFINPATEAGTAVAGVASTPIANVVANDAINGAAATLGSSGNATIAQSGVWPTGIALNTTTGAITTTAAVPPGNYSVAYQLCDKSLPANCRIITDTITVSANIVPGVDSGAATAGSASTAVVNVAVNDTVSGAPATLGSSGNATVAQSGVWPAGITLNPTTGAITTSPTVPAGIYPLVYQLCDRNVPANCSTATATITVAANIVATSDVGNATAGTASTAVVNVVSNDNINGSPAILGTSGNATIAQTGVWPTGLALNPATGAITATANLAPGSYPLSYQLCDKGTPANCATTTVTITIIGNIVPVTESGNGISGTPSTVITNIAANDSVNGSPANVAGASPNATVAQSGTWPTGIALSPTTGAVIMNAAVLPGVYNISYQLCDRSSPVNCAIMTDVVTVTANIAPVADSGSAIAGTPSTLVANIAANDSVNGSPASISGGAANATIVTSGTWPVGITLNPATGAVSALANVVPGNYALQYQLCDRNTPINCRLQTVTITIDAAITPVTESGTAVAGTPSSPIANVRSNDSVNGAAATSINSTLAVSGTWPAGISLNVTTGTVSTSALVLPGTYTISYQLCDLNTPVNCAIMTDTVTVTAAIAAMPDSGFATSGIAATPVSNIVVNDQVNGFAATLGSSGNATVATVGSWPAGIALNPATGSISTSAGVLPGNYSVQYQLCDKNTPANCQTQTISLTINGNIAPLPESGTAVSGTPSTPIANVAANDNVNASVATLGTSGNATISQSGSWPAGIVLDPVTGAINTAASVQPGTYLLTYQLCDKSTMPNCATVTDTVTVGANIAPSLDSGNATAGIAATPIANVASNDFVNGNPASLGIGGNASVAISGTWPAGITLNPATGAIATAATVPPGTYAVQYQSCDKNTPANCQTQTVTITIGAAIVPVLENATAIAGTAATLIADVTSNDTVNNTPATLGTSGNAIIAQSGIWPSGITLNIATGAISTSATAAPGIYPLSYQLCDNNTPANCQIVTDTITINASIGPIADSGFATAGVSSTPVANVATNDNVNGSPAILGASGNAIVAQSGAWPVGVTLNPATGSVNTTPAVPPGTYNVAYQLCDKNSPANCQTQNVTVTVTGAIAPNPDAGNAVSGTAGTPINNIAANDFVNGPAVILGAGGNATIAVGSVWPAGITLNPATGTVATAAAVQPGTYVLPYILCDKVTVPNCANGTATVVVSANIAPVAESGNATSGTAATPIVNVRANDNVNGSVATASNSTIAQSGSWPAGIMLNGATGAITTNSAVQPGNYLVAYQLCDLNVPVNCQTITVTITIAASVLPVTESGSAVSGTASTPIINVASNDNVNGFAATLGASGNATIVQSGSWPTGLTLNTATGAILVDSTVRPGSYPISYQLCDKNTPINCQTISDTITVNAAILPMPDIGASAAGSVQTPIASVVANDTVNGSPVLLGGASPNATITPNGSWPAGVTLNPVSGAISTSASVAPGNYALQYQLCDTNSPVNCAIATASFTLSATINPLPDSGNGISGTAATVITNITSNDRVNGSTTTLAGASYNASVSQSGSWPTGITLNPLNGNVSISASVQPGVYVVTYELCDANSPINCATNINTINVAAAIRPSADNGTATSGTAETPVANVAANDTVNGVTATLGASGNATLAIVGSWPSGITLDPLTGAVMTSANVQPGTYPIQYQLCDKNSPANCAIQTVTITLGANILPTPDAGTSASGSPATPIVNVAANDNVNGFPATMGSGGNAVIAQSGSWPAGIDLDPITGAITTSAAVQPGTYPVQYQLCDVNTPANCVFATATVTVVGAIKPTNDAGSAISGIASTPVSNIASNDVVNGSPVNLGASGNATIAQSAVWPVGITLDPNTGAVSTNASVPPRTYTLQYQLCDTSVPPFCALANISVTVSANIAPTIDTGVAISGTASSAIANVTGNDSVNGAPATLGPSGNATISQISTTNAGVSLNPLTGAVVVAATVQPGSYVVTYRLCDKNTPINCATTTANVTVSAAIAPVTESGTAISGIASITIANVAANDMVNGINASLGASGNATIAVSGNWPAGITIDPTTGAISTSATVQPGVYSITYQLCDKNAPANCATMTDTVTVSGNIRPRLDTGSSIAGAPMTALANIAANDMVNGIAATLGVSGNATVATSGNWPSGVTLDPASSAVAIDASVVPGTYTLAYTLCDTSTPANCANQNAIITVFAAIRPSPDIVTVSAAGGTAVPNVTANDVVNGAPVSLGISGNATVAQSGSWPTGITLDVAIGAVSVAPGTPPGTYTLTYELCDRNLPVNCATTIVTINVTPQILAVTENGNAVSGTPIAAIATVTAGDTVNGIDATLGASGNATVAQIGTWPTGITLDPSSGAVNTDATVQPGIYNFVYRLCDKNTPVNCATISDQITVIANVAPLTDNATMVAGVLTTPITNIAANDTVNGASATLGIAGNATIATTGVWPTGITLSSTTGAVSVGPRVQPGTYALTYNLCDRNTPTNCQTAIATIVVNANIAPTADTGSAQSGTASTPVADIAVNDTVNGTPALVAGSSPTASVAVAGSWPLGFSLSRTTGAISISDTVAPGTYVLAYQLCDRLSAGGPANCANSTATITVNPSILPAPKSGTAPAGAASTPIANLVAGDTVNGSPAQIAGASPNARIATIGTWPVGIALDPATGQVTAASTTPPGVYALQYQLCDTNAPPNCLNQNASVTLTADIAPISDSGNAVSGVASTPVTNIVTNDRVNLAPATLGATGNATIAQSGTWPNGISLDPNTGTISTSASVQPGNYALTYSLCDKNTPANCKTQSVTIAVMGSIVPGADNGSATSGTASTPVANVAANDTVNGAPAMLGSSGNATVALSGTWPIGIALDPQTGAISTSATVQPGVYNVQYELCDRATPANCQLQSVAITVAGNIVAAFDSGNATSGTASTPIANLVTNDAVNGAPATLGATGNATIASVGTWPIGIVLNPTTGSVATTVAVQPGTYTLQYNLCDKSTPANCQPQTIIVTVIGNILPVADTGSAQSGTPATPIANVAANDAVNGAPAMLGTSGNATVAVSGTWPTGITLDPATGGVATSGAVQPGTYPLQYELCDRNIPANCQPQSVSITVTSTILPQADYGTAVSGTLSTAISNLASNDKVNGVPAVLGTGGNATVVQIGAWPTGILLDPTSGAVSIAASVQPGVYNVSYKLCDRNTPANCETQSVSITVAGNIATTPDSGIATSGIASRPIANIASNDMVNGLSASLGTSGNATIIQSGQWPSGISLDPSTGAVSTSTLVQPGIYLLEQFS